MERVYYASGEESYVLTVPIQAGVTKSCTIRLNNEIYCIRDDEQWIDCPNGPGVNDLIIAIEKLHRS